MNAFVGQTFQMNQSVNIKEVVQFTIISRAKIYEMINSDYISTLIQAFQDLCVLVNH